MKKDVFDANMFHSIKKVPDRCYLPFPLLEMVDSSSKCFLISSYFRFLNSFFGYLRLLVDLSRCSIGVLSQKVVENRVS